MNEDGTNSKQKCQNKMQSLILDNIDEVIFLTDETGIILYINSAWIKLTGYSIEYSIGKSIFSFIDDDRRLEWIDRVIGEQTSVRRVAQMTTFGGLRWVEIHFAPAFDSQFVRMAGTLRDIDDRKRLEEHVIMAKRRAEQRARETTILAYTDELTGIANRRTFMSFLEKEVNNFADYGQPLSIAMLDIDHFKLVNDNFGHMTGDKVIKTVAINISNNILQNHVVGRLGGEEFGVLFRECGIDEANIISENIRIAVEQYHNHADSLPNVTISIGLYGYSSEENLSAAEALDRADKALYLAKQNGRNCTRI